MESIVGEGKMTVLALSKTLDRVAFAKVIFHEQLRDITTIDGDEYGQYIYGRRRRIWDWKRVRDNGYYQMTLEISPPAVYVDSTWVNTEPGYSWQEETIYKLVFQPPQEPEPEGYFDAKKLGIQARCVYYMKLGRVEIDVGGVPKGTKLMRWFDDFGCDGRFENILRKVRRTNMLVLERIWQPRLGYCGSEHQVYLITFEDAEPDDDD
jgi:hypothetical protein